MSFKNVVDRLNFFVNSEIFVRVTARFSFSNFGKTIEIFKCV